MKQFNLAASLFIFTSLLSTATFSHASYKDLSTPVAAKAPYNWTGFYGGLNAGLVNHTMDITDNQATSFNASIHQVSNPKFTGGFQVGYRRQLDLTHTSGVFGLEFSTNFSNARYNKEYGSPFALYQMSTENELKDVCLLQFIGGIAADKTLVFLAAGVSWTNISGSLTNHDSISFFNSINLTNQQLGTALGGGVEYAFSEKISGRFKLDVITPTTYTTHDGAGDSFQISNTIVQGTLGVNYRFG